MLNTPESKVAPASQVVAEHLELLIRDWLTLPARNILEIRCLHEQLGAQHQCFDPTDIANAAAFAVEMNTAGFNAYVVVNPIRDDHGSGCPANDDSIAGAFFSFADADKGGAAASLRSAVPAPDFFVVTGTVPFERLHAYWRHREFCTDLPAWSKLQKSIATNLGTDTAVSNPSRIMRLAGTVSWPSQTKRMKGYIPEVVTLEINTGATGQ